MYSKGILSYNFFFSKLLHLKKNSISVLADGTSYEKIISHTGCARGGWWTGDQVKIRNDYILQSSASPPTPPLSNLKHKSPNFIFPCAALTVNQISKLKEMLILNSLFAAHFLSVNQTILQRYRGLKTPIYPKTQFSFVFHTFSAQILGFHPFSVKISYKFESLPVTMINYNTLIFWWIAYTTKHYFLIELDPNLSASRN